MCDPLGYLEFLGLMADAKFVLTDSGGLQEETTALGIPCLTMRGNTERPVTVTVGTNVLVGTDPSRIVESANQVLEGGGNAGRVPPLWDGKAGERIAEIFRTWRRRELSAPEPGSSAAERPETHARRPVF
jgi:UDP-N-acetylglucosamine 2-epimerase (non-hydrolysing)